MVSPIGSEAGVEQAVRPVKMSADKGTGQDDTFSVMMEQTGSGGERLTIQKADGVVDSMNKFLASTNSQLKFVLHEELKEYYVTIVDRQTDEVIREIPPKKLMDIHAAMKEFVGLLVDRKI